MCHLYTFYHICGHQYARTRISCMPSVESRIEQAVSAIEEPQICSDEVQEIKINPLFCENCLELEERSEWMQRTPVHRFGLLRSWEESVSAYSQTERPPTPRPRLLRNLPYTRQSSPSLTDGESIESPNLRATTPSTSSMVTIYENKPLDITIHEPVEIESAHASPEGGDFDTDKPHKVSK